MLIDKLKQELKELQERIDRLENHKDKHYAVIDLSGTLLSNEEVVVSNIAAELKQYTIRTASSRGLEQAMAMSSKDPLVTVPWKGYTNCFPEAPEVDEVNDLFIQELEKICMEDFVLCVRTHINVAANYLQILVGSDLSQPVKFVLSRKDIRNDQSIPYKIMLKLCKYYDIPVFYTNDRDSLVQAVNHINSIK